MTTVHFLTLKVYLAIHCFQLYILHDMVRYCCKLKHPTEVFVIKYAKDMSVLISSSQIVALWLCTKPQAGSHTAQGLLKVSQGQS